MEQLLKSFEVYGYTIEVHAGGRRVWPPSFKRYVTQQLDDGGLMIGDVMKECNVSQSLVYKWRADIKRAGSGRVCVREERLFSEVVIEDEKRTTSSEQSETASDCDQAVVRHKPRLLSDNGSCYISGDLAEWMEGQNMKHVRDAPFHPQTHPLCVF